MVLLKRAINTILEYFKTADSLLLTLCAVATAFGMIMIYSATRTYDAPDSFIQVHLISAIMGFIAFFMLSIIDVDIITDRWPILLAFNMLFISTLFIWGRGDEVGNRAWLRFGQIGIQPTEVVKITFALILAKHLVVLRDESKSGINSVLSVGSLLIHFGAVFILIMVASSDLGSALVFVFIFVAMMLVAGLRLLWF